MPLRTLSLLAKRDTKGAEHGECGHKSLGPPAPGRRRPHRSRASSQVPSPAPGQPRSLCPARRTDLRPRHRRSRPSRPPPHPLTSSSAP